MTMAISRVGPRGGIPLGRGVRMWQLELDITSYTNPNGETMSASTLGIKRIDDIKFTNIEPGTAANRDSALEWNKASNKVFAIVVSTGAEVGNGTDIGTFRATVFGV